MKPRIFSCLASCAVARRRLSLVVLAALCLFADRSAWAATYAADVIDGSYRDCRIIWSGDRLTVSFTVDFKSASGNVAGRTFLSRGIAIYAYDAAAKPTFPAATVVSINGSQSSNWNRVDDFTVEFAVPAYPRAHWMNAAAFTAKVTADLYMGTLNYWPAVSVQAANMTTDGDPVLSRTGALYIGPNMSGCRTIDPTKPPPSPVTTDIKVTAPDWDLGELERGKEATQTFATDAQRLCFAYDAKYIEYDKYLISVSSRNGVADNKFLMVNAADGSETVPYTLSFTGGGAPMALPSINGLPLTLGKSGRTCLTPTFKTWVGATIKGGDFSDALTFTITTQP